MAISDKPAKGKGLVSPDPASEKVYHLAGKMRADGAVSAKCFKRPRAIDLSEASWTFIASAVTCKACLAWLAAHPEQAVRP